MVGYWRIESQSLVADGNSPLISKEETPRKVGYDLNARSHALLACNATAGWKTLFGFDEGLLHIISPS